MSQIHAATSDQVTVRPAETLTEEFWEIVCADDDWLRAEFDAIVTAEHPDRRDGDDLSPSLPCRPGPPSRGARPTRHPGRWPTTPATPVRRPARQRSPPEASEHPVLDAKEVMTSSSVT